MDYDQSGYKNWMREVKNIRITTWVLIGALNMIMFIVSYILSLGGEPGPAGFSLSLLRQHFSPGTSADLCGVVYRLVPETAWLMRLHELGGEGRGQ